MVPQIPATRYSQVGILGTGAECSYKNRELHLPAPRSYLADPGNRLQMLLCLNEGCSRFLGPTWLGRLLSLFEVPFVR